MTNDDIVARVRAVADNFLGVRSYGLSEPKAGRLTLWVISHKEAKLNVVVDALNDEGIYAEVGVPGRDRMAEAHIRLTGELRFAPEDIRPVGQAVVDNENWRPASGIPVRRFESRKYLPFEEVMTKDHAHVYYFLFNYTNANRQDMPRGLLLREDGKLRIRNDIHKQHCVCVRCEDVRGRRRGDKHVPSVQRCLDNLERHHKKVEAFYADPMTDAYGVPTDDFQRKFDTQERHLLYDLSRNARLANDVEALRIALDGFEKWMP